jgi:uncharacterized heparinase superfamily protein
MRMTVESDSSLADPRRMAILDFGERRIERPRQQGAHATMVSVADRTSLSLLLLRRALRSVVARLNAHPFVRWRFFPPNTDRLVIAPQDLRTADATRANEIYAGRFAFAGKIVVCDGRSPFEMPEPSDEWAAALHGFGWLRHLRAAESGITRANARALVEEWIMLQGSWSAIAWRPDVLSRRIISWLSQAPLVLHDAEMPFYRRFSRSLSHQIRYLRHAGKNAPNGMPRLQVLIALAYATLCMENQARNQRTVMRRLGEELDKQILPDGGHISRNPNALIELLLDLLPLRQAFAARNMSPPPTLNNVIDRMMPMTRFFRHGDGNFALFNGMGPTHAEAVATVLAYDDVRGAPIANATHSGYQRIETGGTLIIMDTGKPPPIDVSQEAHAGCLSFELSAQRQQIVVNCGIPQLNRENWRQVARATAAYSTVTFNDTSSCHFLDAKPLRRLLFGTVIVAGPTEVSATREEGADGIELRTSHNGYAERFGVVHERKLRVAADGNRAEGEDTLATKDADTARRWQFAVRFHLHPTVKATKLGDGRSITLTLPNKDAWTFTTPDETVELEESVYLGGKEGPRRTTQIVIYASTRKTPRVPWAFERTATEAGEQPKAP